MVPLLAELGYTVDAAAVPARLTGIRQESGIVLVAIDGEKMLGLIGVSAHAVLHAAGPVGLITALVVSSTARGRGVGRQLVERAKHWATDRGCVRLTVTSAEKRADAHAFYPACGLPYTGRRFSVALAPSAAKR